jgi:hypothetical protein
MLRSVLDVMSATNQTPRTRRPTVAGYDSKKTHNMFGMAARRADTGDMPPRMPGFAFGETLW